MNTSELREVLTEQLETVTPPPGDLTRAVRDGRGIRRRRQGVVGAVTVVALVVVGVGGYAALTGPVERGADVGRDFAGVGELDFSGGLRAYADPGSTIHLGGRSFDAADLAFLDTDAAATPYGVVFFDAGRPYLLEESCESVPLVDGPVDSDPDFHPTAQADAVEPLVAWATLRDGVATMTVRDVSTREDVATRGFDCGDGCDDLVIDGLDEGVVFVRTSEGTSTWDTRTDELSRYAPPATRVADVRGGVVVYDGPPPTTGDRWRAVKGPVDAQLTFDGEHLLDWSSRLEPTAPGGEPITLEIGSAGADEGLGFYTIDTDGPVLVAYATQYPRFTVYDCEVVSGRCAELGPLETTGGDPMFIGNDM